MQPQTIPEGVQRIPLRNRDGETVAYALVDTDDYEWLMQWRWSLSRYGYAMRGERQAGKSRGISMHRQLLGLERGDPRQGDHKNRVRLDNRRENLRIAERGDKDNRQNQPSRAGSTSRYRGVYWDKWGRRWRATVKLDGHLHNLGSFASEAEAAAIASAFRAEHMPFSVELP